MLYVLAAVETELVHDIEGIILNHIEIAVVAVTRHPVAVFAVPLRVFYSHILRRNHLAVEESFLGAILLVVSFDYAEHFLYEFGVLRIVGNFKSEEFRSLYHTVDTYGEILPCDIDVTGIEERKHTLGLKVLEILVVADLYLVHEVGDILEEGDIVHSVLHCILYAAVEIDGEHGLGTRGHSAGTEGVAESVVLNFVAQTAAA